MGESQPRLEMGPCLARHPQFGAYFRNCSKNLLLEHRVWRIEHCYTILRGVTSAVGAKSVVGENYRPRWLRQTPLAAESDGSHSSQVPTQHPQWKGFDKY